MENYTLNNPISKIIFKIIFVSAFTIFFIPVNSFAQSVDNNFSSIRLSASLLKNQNNDPINNYWNQQTGIEGKIETPFYSGNIFAGLRQISFKGKKAEYHNFSTNYYFAGWDKELKIINRFNLFLGFKVGGFAMSFSDDSLTIYQKDETELAAGVTSGFYLNVIQNFYLNASVEYSRVFTHKRIEFFFVSAGIAYKFNTPEWMKDFLK